MKSHDKTFFGKKSAMGISSSDYEQETTFLRFIKNKSKDGDDWEKPSKGEGKTVAMSLGELIMIHKVFKNELDKWDTYHSYKDKDGKEHKTSIGLNWKMPEKEKDVPTIFVNIGGDVKYTKPFVSPEIELIEKLLEHLIDEKIAFATKGKGKGDFKKGDSSNEKETKRSKVEGVISEATDKALLVKFDDGKEIWFPRSTVEDGNEKEKDETETVELQIDDWILQKNGVSTES